MDKFKINSEVLTFGAFQKQKLGVEKPITIMQCNGKGAGKSTAYAFSIMQNYICYLSCGLTIQELIAEKKAGKF
jgi:hypothetical protein